MWTQFLKLTGQQIVERIGERIWCSKSVRFIVASAILSNAAALPALCQDVDTGTAHGPWRTRLYQSFPRTHSVRLAAKPAPPEAAPASAALALKRAKALEKGGDYSHAIDLLASAIKSFPSSRELYAEHADCCIHERRLQDALKDTDISLTKGAPTAVIYRQRAQVNYMLHDYTSCVKDFDKLAKLGSPTANDYFTNANCYASLGNTKTTLENLSLGLKLDPKNSDAYYLRAKTYKLLNQNALADADFAKAMSLQKLQK